MKKMLVLNIAFLLIIQLMTGCSSDNVPAPLIETRNAPAKAPLLNVNLTIGNLPVQRIQAAQLTTSWLFIDENGDGGGYEADSPHPLQLSSFDGITLGLENAGGEIELLFGDNYPPVSVSVQRWDEKYADDESTDAWDKGEPVEISRDNFRIDNDGQNYIYAVSAKWKEGSSWYTFRIENTARQHNAQMPAMIIKTVVPGGISLTFENNTDMGFTFGEDYTVYIRTNNSWQPVDPIIDNWGFNSIGYDLPANSQSDEVSIDWRWLYGDLTSGIFLFEKEILYVRSPGDFDKYVLRQEFNLP